jgi:hypothetical protein
MGCMHGDHGWRRVSLALCLVAIAVPGWGSPAFQNPELRARDPRDFSEDPKPVLLHVSRFDVDIAIDGDVARTSVLATFDTPNFSDPTEGDFVLSLPAQSIVTGYALDVDGKMLDGVLVGARKGKQIYEKRVRRGVDPGLAEVTRANAFRTHVYPIMPKKGRTIRVAFVTPLIPGVAFQLPLAVSQPIASVSIHVTATGVRNAPELKAPGAIAPGWTRTARGFEARTRITNSKLSGVLAIGPVVPASHVLLARFHDGTTFFEINDAAPAQVAENPRRVRVYWDTSRSRRDADLKAERMLLHRYLTATHPATIDVVLFADGPAQVRTFHAVADSEAALTGIAYHGATSFRAIRQLQLAAADTCLLFSDGRVTMDSYNAQDMQCPLSAISSTPDADRGFLSTLTEQSGGDAFDLTAQTADSVVYRLLHHAPRVAKVTANGQPVGFSRLAAAGNRYRIVGPAPANTRIDVTLTDGTRRSHSVGRPHPFDGLAALWASRHVIEMAATDRADQAAILAIARRYSIATPDASFVVLESGEDYAEAGVDPPPGLGEKEMDHYRDDVRRIGLEAETAKADRLDHVISAWNEQKQWWMTDFAHQPKEKQTDRHPTGNRPLPAPPPRETASSAGAGSNSPISSEGGIQTVVVTASRRSASGTTIEVESAPWNPDRPYLKALEAAAPGAFWAVYAQQEQANGAFPAFYLDVAEYLFRHDRKQDAIEVVLSALDVSSADTATLTIVADRPMRYGDEDHALWLYEHIAFLEPERPQPLRNLAVALIGQADHGAGNGMAVDARRAAYTRALTLLNQILTTPWDGAFDGIELISLMEANRILPRARELGVAVPLDPSADRSSRCRYPGDPGMGH